MTVCDFRGINRSSEIKKSARWLLLELIRIRRLTLIDCRALYEALEDFIQCSDPEDINVRTETERFHCFTYEELIQRDKVSPDISGSRTKVLKIPKTYRTLISLWRRSLRTLRLHLISSAAFIRNWRE